MGKARVYSAMLDGKERMVEANSAGQAELHIARVETARVRERIADVRPASSIAVSTFVRGGGQIETAGVIPPAAPAAEDRSIPRFLVADDSLRPEGEPAPELEPDQEGKEDGADA